MTNMSEAPRQIAWQVFLGGKEINTVYFTPDCGAEYVKNSLVDHDGMNPNIQIRKRPFNL